ncbi:MAG: hypothetical protein AB7V42_03355 [Thermoleophilia bacterium]
MRHAAAASAAFAVAAALCAAGIAQARPSATGPWVVRDLGKGRAIVAGYDTASGARTLRDLRRAWGPPQSIGPASQSGAACRAVWARPRARVVLANLGLLPRGATACAPRWGRIQEISTIGPRWRTDRGLRVGAASADTRALHPAARLRPWPDGHPRWLLRPYRTGCIGDCGGATTVLTSAVRAEVRREAIYRFHAYVGAAGE